MQILELLEKRLEVYKEDYKDYKLYLELYKIYKRDY